MAVSPFEVIVSPAKVYVAAVGTAFPTLTDTAFTGFTYLGYTDGGIEVSHTQTINYVRIDQSSFPIKSFRPEESLTVKFSLAQLTLETYAKLLDKTSVTSAATDPVNGSTSVSNRWFYTYKGVDVVRWAMVISGASPYLDAKPMQYRIPVVVQSGNPKVSYTRTAMAKLDTEWMVLADLTQDADSKRFGYVIAQDA